VLKLGGLYKTCSLLAVLSFYFYFLEDIRWSYIVTLYFAPCMIGVGLFKIVIYIQRLEVRLRIPFYFHLIIYQKLNFYGL